jgi:EAL domain-containing protein (putative c-di-GMP-specific phosphodiesterase class I)
MPALTKKADELEIAYRSEELIERLEQQQLSPRTVFSKLRTDRTALTLLQNACQDNMPLFDLCQSMKNWQSNGSAATFTTNINQLIFLWLTAFNHNKKIDFILNILKCFTLNGIYTYSKSIKFHLFIHHIFIETLNQHHLISLDYAVNFDENSQLTHSHQLRSQLNATLNQMQMGNDHVLALLSLQFQIESNAFLLPQSTSQDLNKQLAYILQKNIGTNNQLYFNGDYKFDLLMQQVENITQINLLIAKIFRAFEDVVFINKQSILVKPFIGYSYTTAKELNADELYRQTKTALEHAIKTKKPYTFYNDALEKVLHDQIILESQILDAFDSNNLTLSLQPIVDLKNIKCVGAELLLRGSDRTGTPLPPDIIVEVLNNAGKGKLFTRWLINTACRYEYELRTIHGLNLYLTLNLRTEDLHDTELPALFSNALSLWKLDPKNIILEIIESGILEENEQTSIVINALSILGFKFALDDFGTGLSSMARLRALPIHLIKIDQSFIKHIATSQKDYEIVQSIAMLARSLGKEVVAEGVENKACLNQLKKIKIDKCQGYFYTEALPYATFIAWAQAH